MKSNIKTVMLIIVAALFLFSCNGEGLRFIDDLDLVSDPTAPSTGGSSSGGGGGGAPAGLIFSDAFNTNGDIVGATWDQIVIPGLGTLEHPSANSGVVSGPVGMLPSGAMWTNPSAVNLSENYQQLTLRSTATPGSGSMLFFPVRFNAGAYTGYSCTFSVDGGTGVYEVSISRVDPGPTVTTVNLSGSSVQSTLNATTHAPNPVVLGCELDEVTGQYYIRAYVGDGATDPVMIVQYQIGTHASDGTPLSASGVGFGFQSSTPATNHHVDTYELYGAKPF